MPGIIEGLYRNYRGCRWLYGVYFEIMEKKMEISNMEMERAASLGSV